MTPNWTELAKRGKLAVYRAARRNGRLLSQRVEDAKTIYTYVLCSRKIEIVANEDENKLIQVNYNNQIIL